MPDLSAHQSAKTTKLLLIGDSGGGKTGALAALAAVGYRLRIMDFDNGLDVLASYLKGGADGKTGPYAGLNGLANVKYETITDKRQNIGNKLIQKATEVWPRTLNLLQNWGPPHSQDNLGPIASWGPNDILVVDSMTMLAKSAMDFGMMLNARLGGKAQQSDWYDAQNYIEGLIQTLYDESIKCNIIVISHVTYIESENGINTGYPMTIGKALSPKIGRYFNSILQCKTEGQGATQKKVLLTATSSNIELKNTNPLKVSPKYDITWGLAEYFAAVRGEGFVIPSKPVTRP